MSMEFSSRPHLTDNRLQVLIELVLVFSKDEYENDSYVNWWEDLTKEVQNRKKQREGQ